MAIVTSTETQVEFSPQKFAMAEPSKLVTFIKGEPPFNVGRGRRRNPLITAIYNEIVRHRNEWAHVNIPLPDKRAKASVVSSLYCRARKDNLALATSSVFNARTKTYDLWVMITTA
jgi:hypothetical protein